MIKGLFIKELYESNHLGDKALPSFGSQGITVLYPNLHYREVCNNEVEVYVYIKDNNF